VGASYVECQEVHVGPEKLARQFLFGRLWLKNTFPGIDTSFYVKTESPVDDSPDAADFAKAGSIMHQAACLMVSTIGGPDGSAC